MKIYEETLNQMQTVVTLSTHMKSLSKVKIKTEDSELARLIDEAINDMQAFYLNPKAKSKSVPLDLTKSIKPKMVNLKNYCEKMLVNKKPEWQVEAERQGWAPPQGK